MLTYNLHLHQYVLQITNIHYLPQVTLVGTYCCYDNKDLPLVLEYQDLDVDIFILMSRRILQTVLLTGQAPGAAVARCQS